MASESPFAAQLGTNYCPKDNEVFEIQALLVEPTLRLKNLDDEIAELQKAIDKLVEERDGLGVYVDAHKALISPARRLPLDIIQEIFVACIPKRRNCVMSASEAPVLLGRICSSWRALSLTTPRLWASLHIVEPPRERYGSPYTVVDEKVAQRLDTMKMWLGRSGQCPLSISLRSGPDYESPPGTPTTSHSRSGETPSFILDEMAHLTPADVPMLESVAFYPQQNQFPLRSLDWENFGMLSGPRLTSFSTRGNSFIPQILPLLWQQLTALAIEGPVWETMTSEATLQTLARCSQLRTCRWIVNELGNPGVAVSLGLVHPPVELPFLHTLELDFGVIPSNLLHRLSLPRLREFTLHGRIDAHHPIAPFFGVCTCLETLNIDSDSFTKTSLLESLCALPPTMRHLTVYDIPPGSPLTTSLDNDVLAALTPAPEPSAVCCPSLETLTIDLSSLISDEALLRFVTGRMASSRGSEPTLKRVDIQFNRRMTSDIMPTLKPFVEETGLDARIQYVVPVSMQFSPWQGLADAPSPWGLGFAA
ncbi:hypothetical protein DFH08DRAFT_985094 [Mycena albidolilacea]|uniref:F-box domain-containing protein n=1 Tax=Mycena albidolilacea TaxID=1033008 RepID=A0AAD7EW86_9AGAR|nr:hypothetical protein DFH08DRAFT_985094 [Mycena albidolilacea]